MQQTIDLRVTPKEAANEAILTAIASTKLNIDANRIKNITITRRSIDARQKQVMIELRINVSIDSVEATQLADPVDYKPLDTNAPEAIIVGSGPAGLFAALRLIERGIRPIVLERGQPIDERRKEVAELSRTGKVNGESNFCFGEGGAGTFSDGKLYTRSKKRGSVEKILNIFVQHGANENILIDVHPHIGTERLPEIIKQMRHTIERCGGKVLFNTRMDSLIIRDNHVRGVVTHDGREFLGPVILATGHSARDVYDTLLTAGATLEPKGIAVGCRLEHPQELIDRIRYHNPAGRGKYLPPAEYTMLTRADGRAVYSFCMCPGGVVIPAASSEGELVVNGMSPSNRGTRWANSGMVVEILPEDIEGDSPLKMMEFQQKIERDFYAEAGGTLNAPAQRMKDFVDGKRSSDLPRSSYACGIHSARIDQLLPREVASRLQKGFSDFGRKHKGFLCNDAILLGAETRTSAPVKVCRDPLTLQQIRLQNLYPAGEGAGYAGGIVSAAIDGKRCADALADQLLQSEAKAD